MIFRKQRSITPRKRPMTTSTTVNRNQQKIRVKNIQGRLHLRNAQEEPPMLTSIASTGKKEVLRTKSRRRNRSTGKFLNFSWAACLSLLFWWNGLTLQ